MKKIIFSLMFGILFAHDVKNDFLKWNRYSRASLIQSENNGIGIGSYFRLKRSTKFTFKDVRLFAHWISNADTYFKLRYKDSYKFNKYGNLYKFTVVSFDRNEKIGLNIRSHGSSGVGIFLLNYSFGHINSEISFSYDIMDHLNSNWKSSYLKIGSFWDNELAFMESKLEFEVLYQISDAVANENLSRIEILFELFFPINNNISLITGYEREHFFHKSSGHSIFFSIGYKSPLNLKL